MLPFIFIRFQEFNTTLVVENDLVEIKCCKFIDIKTQDNGGAIQDTRIMQNLSLTNCLFNKCSSSQMGGAVFCLSLLDQRNNYYTNCAAASDGHACFTASSLHVFTTANVAIVLSAPTDHQYNSNVLALSNSDNEANYLNISQCSSKTKSGAINLQSPKHTKLQNMIVDNCTGNHLFYISLSSLSCNLHECFYINNQNVKSAVFIIYAIVSCYSCYFYNNYQTLCQAYTGNTVDLILENCYLQNEEKLPTLFKLTNCTEAKQTEIKQIPIEDSENCPSEEIPEEVPKTSVSKVIILIYASCAIVLAIAIHQFIKKVKQNRRIEENMNMELIRDGEIVVVDVDDAEDINDMPAKTNEKPKENKVAEKPKEIIKFVDKPKEENKSAEKPKEENKPKMQVEPLENLEY